MSTREWNRFKSALQRLNKDHDAEGLSTLDKFTKMHLDNVRNAHGNAHFFPWHRMFLASLEQKLQQIDHRITIPYWVGVYDS